MCPMRRASQTPATKRGASNIGLRREEAREWVGGRLLTPFTVMTPEPRRPEIVLWLELPDDLVVGVKLLDRDPPAGAFANCLRAAMTSPMAGPPRRPHRIRVADHDLAAEIEQAALGIEVVVAPTPELDTVLQLMASDAPRLAGAQGAPSYFEGGPSHRRR
jgi:hypothetical protein